MGHLESYLIITVALVILALLVILILMILAFVLLILLILILIIMLLALVILALATLRAQVGAAPYAVFQVCGALCMQQLHVTRAHTTASAPNTAP